MEVHGEKARGIPLFLYAAPDDDRRSDRQMSALRVRMARAHTLAFRHRPSTTPLPLP